MAIKTLVLDFDGTCTDIPAMEQSFLDKCFEYLSSRNWITDRNEWRDALDAVRAVSPDAGWTLGGIPSAPAAADPYILSGEAIGHIARSRGMKAAPKDLDAFGYAYPLAIAPFRPELRSVLEAVDARGIAIHFVSNSSTTKINERLGGLLADAPALRARITVQGSAEKFVVNELPWDDATIPAQVRRAFQSLPAAGHAPGLKRPLYLRRPSYMRALSNVWAGDMTKAASTLVCGDIWELDLALPAVLGCAVHLIERAAPYDTCGYERAAASAVGATVSVDLKGLLSRLDELRAA